MTTAPILEQLGFVLQGGVAVLGFFIAVQAYRGYARHGVETMRYLAVGIALLTTVPIVLSYALTWVAWTGDAGTLLVVGISYLLGLGALDVAFNYSSE